MSGVVMSKVENNDPVVNLSDRYFNGSCSNQRNSQLYKYIDIGFGEGKSSIDGSIYIFKLIQIKCSLYTRKNKFCA